MSAIETNENLEVVDNEFSQFAPNLNALLKRIFIFLEDGEWDRAYKHCEIVLDQDPENAQAYLGELMAELHVNTMEGLSRCGTPYSDKNTYKRLLKYGDDDFVALLKSYCAKNEEICAQKEEEQQKKREEKAKAAETKRKKERKKTIALVLVLSVLVVAAIAGIVLVFLKVLQDYVMIGPGKTTIETTTANTTSPPTTAYSETTTAHSETTTTNKREDIKDNADKIIEAFEIKEFQISSNYFVMLKNTSEYDLDISLKGVFYNADGSLIGAKDGAATAVQAGGDAIFEFHIGEEVAKSELSFSIAGCIINFPKTSMVELKAQESSGRKVFATFVNGSEETLYLTAWVIFYQDGKEVCERSKFEMNYAPGSTLVLEFDTLLVDFDSYKVFYRAYSN